MNLEAWLRQDHSLSDQLKVIEGLCRALNEAHTRGIVHRGLVPGNIEVDSEGRSQLGGAVSGSSAPPYRAPELSEGGTPSPQSDIYSAGVICYEMLSGETPSGDRPTPLGDLRSDVSRDLTDAVMGCLERGPDWRPKDLSYLLQVVGALRTSGGKAGGKAASRAAEPARPAPKAAANPPRRGASRGASRSNLPLLAAVAVLALGAGVGYWFYFKQSGSESPVGSHRPQPASPAPPTPPPPVVVATPTPAPAPVVVTPKVVEAPRQGSAPTPAATPVPTPTPRVVAVATPEPRPVATPAPVVAVPATPPPTLPPATAAARAPAEPALLTAVSPLSIRRGGQTMLDLRGSGLRPDHQARIVRVKEATNGISVVRQKFVDPTLIKVLVNLDASVTPGAYAVVVTDPAGAMTNTLSFTVAK